MSRRIRILATSDVHGTIYPYRYSDGKMENQGLARLSTLIAGLRDENTILVDNGDILEGSPLSFYHYHQRPQEVSPMTQAFNAMHYDFVNLGNHDFNYGEKALLNHIRNLDAGLLTSNVLYKDRPLGYRYAVKEFFAKKVVLIGVVTHYIPHWESPQHIRHFQFRNALESLRRTVELARRLEHPDYVVVLYHGGFERDLKNGYPTEELTGENQAWEMLQSIPGIDILITGHQHRSLAGRMNQTVYTQTADNGREIACIDIDVDSGEILPRLLPADMDPDPQIEDLALAEERACQTWLDQPLGTASVNLRIENEQEARLHKSQLITFFNKVMQEKTGAQLAASALFPGAQGLGPAITMRQVVSSYPYPNTLVLKKVSGKTLRAYLEKDAEYWTLEGDRIAVSPEFVSPQPKHYNYDMLDGVDYTIKVANPRGRRIVSLTYQGQEITDDMSFTLCLNNYRATGGGNFDMLARAETLKTFPDSMVDLTADYILRHQTIDFAPVDNIQVIR